MNLKGRENTSKIRFEVEDILFTAEYWTIRTILCNM